VGNSNTNPWIGQRSSEQAITDGTAGSKPRQKRRLEMQSVKQQSLTLGINTEHSESSASELKTADAANRSVHDPNIDKGRSNAKTKHMMTQDELVARAFVGGGQDIDFEQSKQDLVTDLDRKAVRFLCV